MDILDPYYENYLYRRAFRRERVFRDRLDPIDFMPDDELYEKFRFNRGSILLLTDCLQNLSPKTQRNYSLPAHLRVCIGLRFLGSNGFQNMVGDTVRVQQSTVSRVLDQFLDAMLEIVPQLVKWPENSEATKQHFFERFRIPDVVGVIDGTHVQITAPVGDDERVYVNRLSYHSINVQAVCNENSEFLNCVANKPGSFHDSTILQVCIFSTMVMVQIGGEY